MYRAQIYSQDPQIVLDTVVQLRRLLSIGAHARAPLCNPAELMRPDRSDRWPHPERDPPIQEVIDAGLVPKLVEFLGYSGHATLQACLVRHRSASRD